MHIVIIGSGVAGISFAEKLRTLTDHRITLITHENQGYYSRPQLSRGFSQGDIEQTIVLKTFEQLAQTDIQIVSGTEITGINRRNKTISYQDNSCEYDILIMALGSSAFIPPPFRPFSELFFCLNSFADLKMLRQVRGKLLENQKTPRWAIIGGGLIGCELASDIATVGDCVTVFHAMDRLMERQLVAEDSALLLKVLKNLKVEVFFNQAVQSFTRSGDKVCVNTERSAEFDALIVACGFSPRTELAKLAGLDVGRGIKVNEYLQTNDEAVYALGDVAELPGGKLYPFILPIRNQAVWLANYLAGKTDKPWVAPIFTSKAKVHGFEALHPYNL